MNSEWRLFTIVNHLQKLSPAGNKEKIFSHSSVNMLKYGWQRARGHENGNWPLVATQEPCDLEPAAHSAR